MKKVFCTTMFGTTFPWFEKWQQNMQNLAPYGWEWRIFTPNTDVKTVGNCTIVPMTTEQFVNICDSYLGVRPNLFRTESGVPSVHVTDFYCASGMLFSRWLGDADFWGICGPDTVFGRLDHFIPDTVLEGCDVMSDDTLTLNGTFSLFRNREDINNLFREIPNWKDGFTMQPCKRCTEGAKQQHTLTGTDEYGMTAVLPKAASEGRIVYAQPQHYPMHSHDRLEQHIPEPKLELKEDGSLWELFKDTASPDWPGAHPFLGNEIGYFHFIKTKKWPTSLN